MHQPLTAWFLHRFTPYYNRATAPFKRDLFRSLSGSVLEIGAGTGANCAFLPPAVREWTAAEPNVAAHRYAMDQAETAGLKAHWSASSAESLDFEPGRFDAVICTLTLCSVRDVRQSLAEARRVLKAGGRLVFLEHVAAPQQTPLRRKQQLWRPVLRCCLGCDPTRDTATAIEQAGFKHTELRLIRVEVPLVSPHIAGFAVK